MECGQFRKILDTLHEKAGLSPWKGSGLLLRTTVTAALEHSSSQLSPASGPAMTASLISGLTPYILALAVS